MPHPSRLALVHTCTGNRLMFQSFVNVKNDILYYLNLSCKKIWDQAEKLVRTLVL